MNIKKLDYFKSIGVIVCILEEACNTKVGAMTTRIKTLKKISIKDVISSEEVDADVYYECIDKFCELRNVIVHSPLDVHMISTTEIDSMDDIIMSLVLYRLAEYSSVNTTAQEVYEAYTCFTEYVTNSISNLNVK